MLNVIKFHESALRFRKDATRRSAKSAVADISILISRFAGLHSKARTELRDAIVLLGLAAQHARQVGQAILDPALKKHFDDELSRIDELLQLARDKTFRL